ncbi:WYL domain-containing protein [Lachnospiraceae bacterium OttesenSCG-928-E19]|nr:WYL domain-containing protein [Lachnospiraceae bacterium OttesenSCG-928-E19]
MAKSRNQKLKLLYLVKILEEKTDEEHTLSTKELIRELEKYEIKAERKSIYDDIYHLQEFGYDIILQKEQPTGYYLASREFEIAELKLLVDAVQSSKFITYKKSNELIRKLEHLCSVEEAKSLRRQVFVADRIKTMNESIYYNVDKIYSAMSLKGKISFLYDEWTIEKKLKPRRGGERYKVTPKALTWEDENYYLVARDEKELVKHYRVDKMRNIELSNEKAGASDEIDLAKLAKRTFGMFGGEEDIVKLRVKNQLIGVIIDRFGKDVPVRADGEEHFIARVEVAISGPFFGWIFGLGEGVEIVSPEYVVEDYKQQIERVRENMNKKVER